MAKKSNKTEHVLKLITKDSAQNAEEQVTADRTESEAPAESCLITDNDHLVNLAELLVKDNIEQIMKKMNACTCDTCTNDIMAFALNSLPTKYVTTDSGKQYVQLEIYRKQYEIDVMAALTKACVRVKASPRH